MAQSVQNTSTPYSSTGSGDHTMALTLGSGTYRKVVIFIGTEQSGGTFTPTVVRYNGNDATVRVDQAVGSAQRCWLYEYDVPDALGAGSYNVTYTTTTSSDHTAMAWQTVGSATGAPEDTDSGTTAAGVSATVSGAGMTVTAGSLTLVGVLAQNADATWSSYTGGITERVENDEAEFTTASADGVQAGAGSITPTATASNITGAKVLVAMSIAAAAVGPTIDTQPTAQTARINGEADGPIATFTVAATTSGGTLVYDWELEDGVASGVYANVADGSGATWTGRTTTTLVGTFTATTLTGRRVRCNVTDDNGTTTTNAVALTVMAGPVTTASDSVTNGSGVATLAYHSDDALGTNGELLLWTITARGQPFYIVTRPS